MRAIIHGKILLPDREESDLALLFQGERIVGLVPWPRGEKAAEEQNKAAAERAFGQPIEQVIDAEGLYVSPGLIDIHIHGFRGADTSDGEEAGLHRMARLLPQTGVTAFLPTTMTVAWNKLEDIFCLLRTLMAESRRADFAGAEILGCHAEGPFINPDKKGAQVAEHILPPQAERILPYADVIRLLTLAPEMPGGLECIRTLRAQTAITLSLGHTGADYDTARAAIQAGANHITHLFNAMPPLLHRAPGPIAAALADEDVYCELIADTLHVDRALFPLLNRLKGPRMVLISDCTRAGSMPDGEYTLGGQPILVQSQACRLRDGTLAGSVLRLNEAVRNWREYAHVPLFAAVRAASLSPAKSIGLQGRKGSLEPGKDADILLMDDACQVKRVFLRGRDQGLQTLQGS